MQKCILRAQNHYQRINLIYSSFIVQERGSINAALCSRVFLLHYRTRYEYLITGSDVLEIRIVREDGIVIDRVLVWFLFEDIEIYRM